jgi:hypothetical protein
MGVVDIIGKRRFDVNAKGRGIKSANLTPSQLDSDWLDFTTRNCLEKSRISNASSASAGSFKCDQLIGPRTACAVISTNDACRVPLNSWPGRAHLAASRRRRANNPPIPSSRSVSGPSYRVCIAAYRPFAPRSCCPIQSNSSYTPTPVIRRQTAIRRARKQET